MNWKKGIAAVALWCAAGASGAVGHAVDVTVYDRAAQRTLPVHRHEGRWYIEGRPGNEYEIRVRNRGRSDVLAVISVDGVNAVTGETAHWSQTGYVLAPGGPYRIEGWRKSTERVAAFYFTSHRNAYATRTGRPDHVGVIGVAVFHPRRAPNAHLERPRWQPWPDDEAPWPEAGEPAEDARADAAPAAGASAAERSARDAGPARRKESLGTGHGRSLASRVTYADFERATERPAEVIAIHYDTRANLVAMGVIRAPRYARPSPFPGGFVPDP